MSPRTSLHEDPMDAPSGAGPHERPERRQCVARSKQSGERCKRAPIVGGTTCSIHGGNAPAARAAAARRVQEQTLHAAAVTYGLPRDIGPAEALLEEIRATAGHVLWLRERVQELQADELTWGREQYTEGADGSGEHFKSVEGARPHVLLDLYDRERKTLVDLSRTALSAGVEERRVRLAEQTGAMVAQVIRRVLEGLNLSVEQQALVSTVVPRELRALTVGGGQQ